LGNDGGKLATFHANAALDTLGCVDGMRLLHLAADGTHRTFLGAERTAAALIGKDHILNESLTYACRALLVLYVGNILIAEVTEGAENRIGRGLAQSAQG